MEIDFDKEYMLSHNESIKAFKTDHTVPSCGYIYKKENTSVLITVDTYSLENAIKIINDDNAIKSIIVECSFPSSMQILARESKHLTPKLLSEMLGDVQREDIQLYINHIKPSFVDVITQELEQYCKKWKPIILMDGEIIKF